MTSPVVTLSVAKGLLFCRNVSFAALRMTPIALAVVVACAKDADTPPPNQTSAAAPASFVPSKYAPADLKKLAWLEGAWRGQMANGTFFYESYHVVNDSLIAMHAYTDSTLKTKSDSSLIVYSNGEITHRGSQNWSAATLDSSSVDFLSPVDRRNHFTWTRANADAWTAKIFSVGPDGTERVTTYQLARLKR